MSNSDADLERELIETFYTDCEDRLVEIARRIEQHDAPPLRLTAHALKGAAANMGARRIRELAQELEEMAASGRLDTASGVLAELRHAYQMTRKIFLDYLESGNRA